MKAVISTHTPLLKRWSTWAIAAVALGAGAVSVIGFAQGVAAPAASASSSSAAAPKTSTPAPATPEKARDPQVVRGEYLAQAGDCISCHTRTNGAPFAGGLPMKTPFGTIISTNITPDKDQGIGNYTLEDFTRALREGKAADGHHLYPAMPYTNFARLQDADLQSLYAYFMQGVAPQKQDNPKTDLAWPFSMRGLMAGWNLLYLRGKPYEDTAAQSAEWNRGAYLVQGLGHCSACHTPRSFTGAEKASTEKGSDLFLAGALIDGWYAQPLRNTAEPGLGTWSVQEIAQYLKTGRTAHTAAFGAMAEVVANSTQHLSKEDLTAIGTYLKSIGDEPGVVTAVAPSGTDPTAAALRNGEVSKPGALVFINNCAACHRSTGQGVQKTFPAFAHSSSVAAKDPTSLIRIVLEGSAMPHTKDAPSQLGMPGLGWRLTDANVADVLTFVRSSWGNQAPAVSADEVAKVRAATAKQASK